MDVTLRLNMFGVSANPRDHIQIVRSLRRVTRLSPVFLFNCLGRWHGERTWWALDIHPSITGTHAGRDELRAIHTILHAYGMAVLLPDQAFNDIVLDRQRKA